ncbi:MAG: hypothetical protein Q7T18_00920, partial [Sedimentisphaerales bacterium]|nr:hypothetical protein [Sedimentisphaerales bacterium]
DLIMFDNGANRISLLHIDSEKNIFCRTQDNQVTGVTLGPGETMLRLTAAATPEVRGVCKLTVEPIFKSTAKPDSISAVSDELAFDTVSFIATLSPGDFILLGPAAYAPQDMTLGSIFFSSPDKSAVLLYLIVCTEVNN